MAPKAKPIQFKPYEPFYGGSNMEENRRDLVDACAAHGDHITQAMAGGLIQMSSMPHATQEEIHRVAMKLHSANDLSVLCGSPHAALGTATILHQTQRDLFNEVLDGAPPQDAILAFLNARRQDQLRGYGSSLCGLGIMPPK
mmetsp:Transcript_6877/g.12163  ORF Transcript_6877/g.12163 Transcript_6877/m.12163 type:complete len:142 (-) Transcript_6877:102-527(-)|eukprot:CAMPEP_0197653624 /NCGR_PEP_ID=MMETSP1338-20131121/36462_1 /TAXON_ID=43686 ORGANISM="Pelagodinium beii, Strain RCC1491" /NCGR_SAMPLE_ID=MMETSP1338 /ASSEMBLY_ACC=CAM_ASM_000754 /LENGTH=141 /DNA_ID=CAMNT_0043228815 /DNA_START=54 /DNA_END=479 /DNA_ORIENTATION=-